MELMGKPSSFALRVACEVAKLWKLWLAWGMLKSETELAFQVFRAL